MSLQTSWNPLRWRLILATSSLAGLALSSVAFSCERQESIQGTKSSQWLSLTNGKYTHKLFWKVFSYLVSWSSANRVWLREFIQQLEISSSFVFLVMFFDETGNGRLHFLFSKSWLLLLPGNCWTCSLASADKTITWTACRFLALFVRLWVFFLK